VESGLPMSRGALRNVGSALLVATIALLGVGCGRGAGSAATPPITSPPLPVAGSPAPYTPATCDPGKQLLIVAKADKFSLNCVATSAGTPTTIMFINKDSSQHNLAIYEDAKVGVLMPAGDDYPALFRGDPVAKQAVYDIPPLASGTYYFRCDIHPLMNGTFLVA
jgi:plastocyanin